MSKIIKNRFKRILARPYENLPAIRDIEVFLRKKRGYTIRMPKPGSDIIHLVSGGIDSITTWAILMEKYRLKVHPIAIKTWQEKHKSELKSLSFYSKLFKERYPDLYVEPFEITYPSSPPEIKQKLTRDLERNVHPQVIRDYFDPKTNSVLLTRKFLYPAFVTFPAARAALFFETQRNKRIRTISTGILPSDGYYNESQTLTSLRGAMLALCTFTNDYSWQIFSLCFEKDIPSLFTKTDLVKWAHKNRLPLQFTYSCLMNFDKNCGICVNCQVRREAFKKAGVKDLTKYENGSRSWKKFLEEKRKKIYHLINYSILHKKQIVIKDYTQ